jgi:uncharacterized protein YdhG (YjbR/CyaY superfamily)
MRNLRRKKRKAGRTASKGVRTSAKAKRAPGWSKRASGMRKGEPARSRLKEMRAAIRAAVPAEAVEIISYRIPAFKAKKVLVWYAAFSGHCSLFPTASVIEEFQDALAEFTTSKGTVQFPTDKALPTALITKLVKARTAQCEQLQRS